MSTYAELAAQIRTHAETFMVYGGCSESLIALAEERLGLIFPSVYRQFVRDFGATEAIMGVIDATFEYAFRPDAIGSTLLFRALKNERVLPAPYIAVYHVGDGEILCLDTSQATGDDAPLVSFLPGEAVDEQRFEIVYPSFLAFLNWRVSSSIEK